MRNPFKRSADTAPVVAPKVEDSLIMRVWKSPASFNRAARRQARLWGRIWRWDPQALGVSPNLPPRYVRRHYNITKFTTPKTRRQRKVRARILRAMQVRP